MGENSSAETVSKLGVGIGIGFALYYLIRNLGFGGGGLGLGGQGGEARGEGGAARGEDAPPSAPPPSAPPPLAPPPAMPPPMPRDEQRLEFVMVRPTTIVDKTTAFRGPGSNIYSLEEMIARVKAGGRTDMTLKVRGDVISGPADAAEAAIKRSGIDIWKSVPPSLSPDKPAPSVSGNARGQYRGRYVAGRGSYR